MQTISYSGDSNYFRLFRGGIDPSSVVKGGYFSEKGLDPYNRTSVMQRSEMCSLCDPVRDGLLSQSIKRGAMLHADYKTYSMGYEKYLEYRLARMGEFFGIQNKIEHKEQTYVNMDLMCCFTYDGRAVLFKSSAKPVRSETYLTNYTKLAEEWGVEKIYGTPKKNQYHVHFWKFKNKSDYIICSLDDDLLFTLLPALYDEKLKKLKQMIHKAAIYASCNSKPDEHCPKTTAEYVQEYNELLWNIEPFSLNDSWDYSDEQKQYIKEVREEIAEQKRKAYEELQRRKDTPGYCDDCGAENASWVADPFAEEMYGTTEMCWLCESCYSNRAMDV